jgi:hypothetical protein
MEMPPPPDTPPLPGVPWRIVQAASKSDALVAPTALAAGFTDGQREVRFGDETRRELAREWSKAPASLWFVYRSRAYQSVLLKPDDPSSLALVSESDLRHDAERAAQGPSRPPWRSPWM